MVVVDEGAVEAEADEADEHEGEEEEEEEEEELVVAGRTYRQSVSP